MSRNPWIDVTDCPYSAKFLVHILENETTLKSDFQIYTSSATANSVLSFLESIDMIYTTTEKKPRVSTRIILTDKGLKTARMFKKIIDGDINESETNHSSFAEEADNITSPGE